MGGLDCHDVDWWIEMKTQLASSYSLMRNNIANLILDQKFIKQRSLIINLRKPTFEELPRKIAKYLDQLSEIINQEQKQAIVKAITSNDYQIVVGGPGTGKHHVIAIILLLAKVLKKKIVVFGVNSKKLDSILLKVQKLQK